MIHDTITATCSWLRFLLVWSFIQARNVWVTVPYVSVEQTWRLEPETQSSVPSSQAVIYLVTDQVSRYPDTTRVEMWPIRRGVGKQSVYAQAGPIRHYCKQQRQMKEHHLPCTWRRKQWPQIWRKGGRGGRDKGMKRAALLLLVWGGYKWVSDSVGWISENPWKVTNEVDSPILGLDVERSD